MKVCEKRRACRNLALDLCVYCVGGGPSQGHKQSNMYKKFGKGCACGPGDILSDRQTHRETDRQTDILITVLCNCSHEQSNYAPICTRQGCIKASLVHSDCCFFAPCTNILTYLLTSAGPGVVPNVGPLQTYNSI